MSSTSTVISIPAELERSVALKKTEHRIKKSMLMHFLIIVGIVGLGFGLHYQYQGEEKSLFTEHENSIVALSVGGYSYALALWAEFKLSWRTNDFKLRIINRFSPLFGALVVGQLLIILLPLPGLAFLIGWAIWMLNAIIKTVKETLQWLRQVILRIRVIIRNFFGYGGSGSSTKWISRWRKN